MPFLARNAIALATLWLLAGALFKLFEGSPNDLPPLVTEESPLDAFLTFRTAIMVELAVVSFVLCVPRVGWVLLALQYVAFVALLVPLSLGDAHSCGCFGGNIDIAPEKMLAVDGALLLGLLLTKPWSALGKGSGLGAAALLPFLAVAVAGPYFKLAEPELPPFVAPDGGGGAAPDGDADGSTTAGGTGSDTDAAPGDGDPADGPPGGTTSPAETGDTGAPEPDEGAGNSDPVAADAEPRLPEFWELRWREWEGQGFYETDVARFVQQDRGAVLPQSHVIVYRQTCEVCAEHLQDVWEEVQVDPAKWQDRTIVLMRIVENKDTPENDLCTVLPEPSEKVWLPALKRGYGITTPMSFDVDEEMVVRDVVDVRTLMGH